MQEVGERRVNEEDEDEIHNAEIKGRAIAIIGITTMTESPLTIDENELIQKDLSEFFFQKFKFLLYCTDFKKIRNTVLARLVCVSFIK